MTDSEFEVFARRLFISFPSLYEWLSGTIDPPATQAVWRNTLRPYQLSECMGIVDDWSAGNSKPFEAYERDKVHLIIRAMISLQHDRSRKRKEVLGRSEGTKYKLLPNTPYSDATMASVYQTLRPLYKQLMDGEMTQDEYDIIHEREFARL